MKNSGQPESDRVRRHTHPRRLKEIDGKIEDNLRFYATQPPEAIGKRIEELNREWSIERWLDSNASTLALSGALLGLTKNKKWLLLSAAVSGFLLQHAISGWCPPVPLLRKLGLRSRGEIDREKFALKALRGDFQNIQLPEQPQQTELPRRVAESINA